MKKFLLLLLALILLCSFVHADVIDPSPIIFGPIYSAIITGALFVIALIALKIIKNGKKVDRSKLSKTFLTIFVVLAIVLIVCFGWLGAEAKRQLLYGLEHSPERAESAVGSAVKSQVSVLGTPATTEAIFNSGDSLSSKTLAGATPAVTKEQVCVLPGDYEGNQDFDVMVPGQLIQYEGTSRISTKLLIMCDYGQDLGETLSAYGYRWANQFSSCECDTTSTSRCCIVAIIEG